VRKWAVRKWAVRSEEVAPQRVLDYYFSVHCSLVAHHNSKEDRANQSSGVSMDMEDNDLGAYHHYGDNAMRNRRNRTESHDRVYGRMSLSYLHFHCGLRHLVKVNVETGMGNLRRRCFYNSHKRVVEVILRQSVMEMVL
jgi:hypothetical protein